LFVVSRPAAVAPAISAGVASKTHLEQLKSIQSEWKRPKKKRLQPPQRTDGINVSHAKKGNPYSKDFSNFGSSSGSEALVVALRFAYEVRYI